MSVSLTNPCARPALCAALCLAAATALRAHEAAVPCCVAEAAGGAPTTAADASPVRREAFDWFLLFTRLPKEAPCELQQEMLDLSFETYFHWLGKEGADPPQAAAWLERLRDLGRRTRELLGATRVEWQDGTATARADAPLALATGLTRTVLLELANRSGHAVKLVPLAKGWQGQVADPVEVPSGASQLSWATLRCDDASRHELEIDLVVRTSAPECRVTFRLPVAVSAPAVVKGRLFEGTGGEPFPGRVRAEGSDRLLRHGKAFADNPTLSEKPVVPLQFLGHAASLSLPFFYSDGSFEVLLPAGPAKVTLERGCEHPLVSETLDLKPGETREVTLRSARFLDMKALGWISGDTHIHWAKNWWSEDEDLGLLKMVQRAEDLRVANNLTLKHHTADQNFIAPTQAPMGPIPGLCDGDYHAQMAEEYRNEELYGHIILLNIKHLIQPISTGFMGGPPFWDWPNNTPAIREARAQGGISIEAHGLGRNNDVPVNVAQDLSDSLDQLEPEDYYRFLDCGFQVPLSNGSDHPARVAGVCRVYVKTELPFTYERWIEGIRRNRTFTTSGPLLFLTVNGKDIGEALDVPRGTKLRIEARCVSKNPVGRLEIVANGRVIATRATDERESRIAIDTTADEPLWVVARASRGASFNAINGPDIAHTSAIHVILDGKPRFRREAAEEWIRRMEIHAADMAKTGRFPTTEDLDQAVAHVRSGIEIYRRLIATHGGAAESTVRLRVNDEDGKPLAARVYLTDQTGKPVDPARPELPFWHDHFACDGGADFPLPAGTYAYQIEKGPEWQPATGTFSVDGKPADVTVTLKRLVDMTAEGWWSGETHLHRDPAQLPLLMAAEDLWVAQATTWWNDLNAWAGGPPADPLRRTTEGRLYHILAGEDEREGGALLFFGLKQPLPLATYPGKTRDWPPSTFFLETAKRQGAWVDAEKPFWQDFPVWLAAGKVDSIGVAHNHLQRDGVLDNEAWGLPRDRDRYPGPHGNGRWSQDLYFRSLNCGLRIPPSAGSASGVLPNPPGYNRIYVHCGTAKPSWSSWWEGAKAGRSFVTNGPLLRVTANGKLPGDVFRTDGGPLQVHLQGRLDSSDPLKAVELIRNGHAETIQLPALVTIHESGWFALRAIADVNHTFRFALTAPWYVELGGNQMKPCREDAAFFLDWTRRRADEARRKAAGREDRQEALGPFEAAEEFWRTMVATALPRTTVRGRVLDARTGTPLPARVMLQNKAGSFFFPESEGGSAVRYEKRNWNNPLSFEHHTTFSAHPWSASLPPGRYTLTVERGTEWRAAVREFEVGGRPLDLTVELERWIDMGAKGWFSGDTHVHRSLAELPNVMLAEDLNVAFPLTSWVTKGGEPPTRGDRNTDQDAPPELIHVDDTHVLWPRNTEWEIFTIDGRDHTLGAVFALGHLKWFESGAPPLAGIARQARDEGALLDMDKPDWPWSLALPPLLGVQLYELANNHLWRAPFALNKWSTPAPGWMLPGATREGTERDWIEYTHRTYWTLLNVGCRLQPSAGTASGVHPVPLGFSRVYVHCPAGFDYQAWRDGLAAGRSFVTNGPMLLAEVCRSGNAARVTATATGAHPLTHVELIVNGAIRETIAGGATEVRVERTVPLDGTCWIALRAWETRAGSRPRFAHTAPVWLDDPRRPLRPRAEEVEFLAGRVRDEIERSRGVLPPAAIAEYERALQHWQQTLKASH